MRKEITMKTIRQITALSLAVCTTASMLTACGDNYDIADYQDADARTDFNTSLDLNKTLAGTESQTQDFQWTGEAEDAKCIGNVKVQDVNYPGFSGTSYVGGFQNKNDKVVFTVEIPADGVYTLSFSTCGGNANANKKNPALVDDASVGDIITPVGTSFTQCAVEGVYLTAGTHEIAAGTEWGYYFVDSLTITNGTPISKDVYNITAELSNPNAWDNTKRLYKFLTDCYGKYTITGQNCDGGIDGKEMEVIYKKTGEYPAMLGLDMMDYTPSRVSFGGAGNAVDYALDFYCNHGGIVTFCWHWNAPEDYLINSTEQPWYSGFRKEATTIDLDAIADGTDTKGKELLLRDIDAIAEAMKPLNEAQVPILWRPLHEASGGWFWWGDCKPESYLWLWNLLYDKLTNEHGLNNLIWVWNGQDPAWYPGDDTVDIIGIDIYPPEHTYTSQSSTFSDMTQWTTERKIVALTENGCMPDPDLLVRDGAMWSWFCTWSGEFIHDFGIASEKYTELSMWEKVYKSEHTLSLSDLPCLWEYPLD